MPQCKSRGVCDRKAECNFAAVYAPAEEGKRQEDICRLRIHGADSGRNRSRHRGGGWSEEVGDQGSRPEILRNLRVCCRARRKRPSKNAKGPRAEKERSERIAKM